MSERKKKKQENKKEELSEAERRQIFSEIFSQLRKQKEGMRYALVPPEYMALFTMPMKYGIDPRDFKWLESLRIGLETETMIKLGRLPERALVVGSQVVREEEERVEMPDSVEETIEDINENYETEEGAS